MVTHNLPYVKVDIIRNKLLQFLSGKLLIKRDHHSCAAYRCKITCRPLIAVFSDYGYSLSLKTVSNESRSQSVYRIKCLTIGNLSERFILFESLPEGYIVSIKFHACVEHVLQVSNWS